jgi:hypothetical protein
MEHVSTLFVGTFTTLLAIVNPLPSAGSVDQNIRQAGAAAALAVIQQEVEERAKAMEEAKSKKK